MERLFEDSKTFADAIAKTQPSIILEKYRTSTPKSKEALREFVLRNFELPTNGVMKSPVTASNLQRHISELWPLLIRDAVDSRRYSSALPIEFEHVVPGGRFREIYYWDSYFTLLGLRLDGYEDVVGEMVDGFSDLIDRYGHIPNGTRTYYLSRSQPPFFFKMVSLISPAKPDAAFAQYLDSLRAEYAFWMAGEGSVKPGQAKQRVVRLPNGLVLNRYWDRLDTPRDESYREDVELAKRADRPQAELYRDIRSAAESGWDFSSRWLADGQNLATIETTSIIPVDLNSLLYGLEHAILAGCAHLQRQACVTEFSRRADRRRAAINHYLWDPVGGRYLDYHWRDMRAIQRLSAATLYPLFVGMADAEQAVAVAKSVRRYLLAPGGLATTTIRTGQQWDEPNGWAPLQWIAVSGLRDYAQQELAAEIAQRWLRTVERGFRESGKLVEKYDVDKRVHGGGGEYPLQDGFGWTNGVTRALLEIYPLVTNNHP